MENNNVARAHAYYTLVGQKNVEGIAEFLHPDVEFYGPLSTAKGKEAVVKATSGFMTAFKSLEIRAQFGDGDQAMIVYYTDIPGISPEFPGASWLQFRDGLIIRIQLFFDASGFRK